MPTTREEKVAMAAAEGSADKSQYVQSIFSEIAPRYDLLNHLLSFNIDRAWRKKAIAELLKGQSGSGRYLDLCAGTLDVSAALATTRGFGGMVIGADFAEPMLRAGRSKVADNPVSPITADALRLPFASGSMAGAIVAFGIRNVGDVSVALREVHRVLEPHGRFVILEFSTPPSRVVNAFYQTYFNHVLPAIGGIVSGHATAYRYLPRSVANFPDPDKLAGMLTSTGFNEVKWRPLTLGVAAIHSGIRG